MDKHITVNVDQVLSRYNRIQQRDYQINIIKEITDGLNANTDVGLILPTGMGKTIIFSPIAAEVAESHLRVAILTATKQGQTRLQKEIKTFLNDITPSLIYGTSNYFCPILNGNAQSWCCNDLKEEFCIPKGMGCDIIKLDETQNQDNLVITNFSKFLLDRNRLPFDLIILDDSHNFENAKEEAFQMTIQCEPVSTFYNSGISDPILQKFVEDFLNIFSEIFSIDVEPNNTEGTISHEHIKKLAENLITEENKDKIKTAITKLNGKEKQLCWDIYYFVDRAKKSSRFQFFIRTDFYERDDLEFSEIISRVDEKTIRNIIGRCFDTARVIFATATPGNFPIHAHSCTDRNYYELGLKITPQTDPTAKIDQWFKKLKILVVKDIQDTRTPASFEQAMSMTIDVLKNFDERTLLLFKNYRDQKLARKNLEQIISSEKLYFIDSITQSTDIVEEYANKKNISIASASSTLWEGINIKNLRIAIITSVPFIRPSVGLKFDYPDLERRMLVRLQQGIGRIIRCPEDYGVAILSEARFTKFVNRSAFNSQLKNQVKFVDKSEVVSEISEHFSQWSK